MPFYTFKCPECGARHETQCRMTEIEDVSFFCEACEISMIRDYQTDLPNTGNKDYATPLISESLGISPDDIPEHRRRHPDVGVLPDGRLKFDNVQSHKKYLKAIGWDKQPSKKKRTKAN